jgi:hypothetical protein
VREAELLFPQNKHAPIAARLRLASASGAGDLSADFDWRHSGGEAWNIDVETEAGTLKLTEGGSRLFVDGEETALDHSMGEYPSIYAAFADLIDERRSDVDVRPLRLVADAYLAGRHSFVEPFEES